MALINNGPLNTVVLNGNGVEIVATGSGDLLQIEQKVAIIASGDLIQIEQAVELLTPTSGDLLQIEQKVNATGSGDLLQLAQRVISSDTHFYTVNGFEPIVTIGGLSVDASNLTENIQVKFTENDNATAVINIRLDPGTYDLYSYQGKTATIDIRTSSGTTRIFTGWVDLPKADVLNEKIELNCVADRRDLLISKVNKNFIGRYSSALFGTKEAADEIEERLAATPQSLDFDGNNNWTLNSWTPKGTADFTLTSADIFRRAPSVSIERRNQIINQINLNFKYGYTRSYHVHSSFVWIHPYLNQGICTFLREFPDIPTKQMIQDAIDGAGWQYNPSLIGWTNLPATGSYNCSGTTVLWSTTKAEYATQIQRDANGNAVTDSNGNNQYQAITLKTTDLNSIYTMGASWNASTRFNQNITEDYTITVKSATSQSRYGTKSRDVTYTYIDPFDASAWENYNKHDTSIPSGAVQTGSSYYLNRDNNSDSFNNAIETAIARARTEILSNHRDTVITFQRDFWKEVQLKHTVDLPSTKWIRGKGKVFSYTHNIDLSDHADHWTEVVLKTYRSTASETDSSVTAPSRPSELLTAPSFAIALQSHYGQAPVEAWTGHIGNKWIVERIGGGSNTYRSTYQEEFRVDVPKISNTYRNTRILSQSATYTVNIPQDTTTIIAYGFTE